MMKTTMKYISLGLVAIFGLASCSDDFLEEKRDYEKLNQDVYNYYAGAKGRINSLYGFGLPNVSDMNWQYPSAGKSDNAGKSTEEYYGFSDFLNPEIELNSMTSSNQVPDFYDGGDASNVQNNSWGLIRDINNAIAGITASTLTSTQKNELLGQAYFFRAWAYYKLVKWYGGVSIVTRVVEAGEETVPRSSAEECINFIVSDLDHAAALLAPFTTNGGWQGSDYGRITSGTALALKGRVLTMWCSPLFNRSKDDARIQSAYETMKADIPTIDKCGYGLYGEGNPGVNGSTFANMFSVAGRNPEAVFATLFNTRVDFSGLADDVKHNRWERDIRPYNTGGGGLTPSKMMVDLFPMADGKKPRTYTAYTKLDNSTIGYDERYPFFNRDPRFYRTFVFPGFRWAYAAASHDNATSMDPHNPSYNNGNDYVLWNYVWFYGGDPLDIDNINYHGADNLEKPGGVLVRKKSDDYDVNTTPLYDYRPDGQGAKNGAYAVPFCSAAPLMELRYAEVLLNYAEVACLAGHTDEAYDIIVRIRKRAGYTGDCGITRSNDVATCMSAILYERQIEFAYEGKRFDDMRQWMLFDGGVGQSELKDSWAPTGWGGNTCTWLGFKPFNGQRRESFIYRVAKDYTVDASLNAYDKDPIADVARPAGIDLRQEDITSQMNTLKEWYEANLVWMQRKGDKYNSISNTPEYINFRPKYYFLGFRFGVSAHNKGVAQTIGWEDYNNGGAMGTYDPFEATSYWSGE